MKKTSCRNEREGFFYQNLLLDGTCVNISCQAAKITLPQNLHKSEQLPFNLKCCHSMVLLIFALPMPLLLCWHPVPLLQNVSHIYAKRQSPQKISNFTSAPPPSPLTAHNTMHIHHKALGSFQYTAAGIVLAFSVHVRHILAET